MNRINEVHEVIDLTDSFSSIYPGLDLNNYVGDNSADITIIEIDETRDCWRKIKSSTKDTRQVTKSSQTTSFESRYTDKLQSLAVKQQSSPRGIGDCPICWEALGKNPLVSTKCGHVFCLKCLELSLRQTRKCPTCRCILKGSSAYHRLYLNRK